MTVRRLSPAALVLTAALLPAASGVARAGDEPPPEKPAGPASEVVTLKTADGMTIAGTYWPVGPAKGPAVVLVHMESSSKAAFDSLIPRLLEHRVPALAIDLRGHGASELQGGKHVGIAVTKGDEDVYTSMHEDVKAAVQWLVKAKGHDPARIGAIGAGLGASVVLDAARRHPEDWSALMLMTPGLAYPGLAVEDWMKTFVGPIAGKIVIIILSSVEDADKGARRLLYTLEYARNAPPKTPDALKAGLRKGVYPRYRGLPDKDATGTKMFGHVGQIEAWIAAWFAREWGTYPNPVLFDGSVDQAYDLADPSWMKGVELPAIGKFTARALRWGRRMMIGADVPMDTKTIRVRSRALRGDVEVGQYAEIDVATTQVRAQPMQHGGARHPPIEIQALVLQGDSGPDVTEPVNPSFEAEIRLPLLPGGAPYLVQLSWGYVTANGTEVNGPGIDPQRPETWLQVADSDPPPTTPAK